jgi:twinkle protein
MNPYDEIGIRLPVGYEKYDTLKVKCPFCADERKKKNDRSMSVWPQEGTYNCHHCGVKGKVSSMKNYNKPTLNANRPDSKVVQWFESSRGISKDALTYYGVTESMEYMPQEGKEMKVINFNYFDMDGQPVNIKYRSASKSFKMFSGGKPILYGLNRTKDIKTIIITEGEMDCLAIYTAGLMGAVSVPNGANKGSNNLQYIDLCWEYIKDKKIVLALDNDEPGMSLRQELIRRFTSNPNVFIAEWPEDCKDANDVLLKHGKETLSDIIKKAKQIPAEGIVSINDVMKELIQLKKGGIPRGDLLGYTKFDEIFSWKKDEMTIITGAPNGGKSAWLDQCMVILAQQGWKFGIISMEKPNVELHVAELIQRTIHKNFWDEITEEEIYAYRDFFDEHFKFLEVDKNELSVDHLIKKAEEMVGRYGIDCFVVDNWSFVELKMPKYGDSRTNHIGDSLTKFKIFKEKFKCAVMIVAHTRKLSKDSQGNLEVAGMYDIAESAHFANKADNILIVHRNFQTGMVDIYTKKVRWIYTGKQGVAHFHYEIPTGTYVEAQEEVSRQVMEAVSSKPQFRNYYETERD